MAEQDQQQPTEPPGSPDVLTIRRLVRLMQRYDLTAIDLCEGPKQIRLRRRGEPHSTAAPAAPALPPPAPTFATGPAGAVAPTEPAPAPRGVVIESPMVGTYYASPAPDAPPFVQVGATVQRESTVCVIEAMKVFTDIPAGVSGTVLEILAKSGQPVEFGQPLFRVEPS